MSTLQIALMLMVLVLLMTWLWLRRHGAGTQEESAADRIDTVVGWPPKATRVLNTRELQAYASLSRGLPEYMILAQVPLSRFVNVPKRNSYADWLRRVGYQCVDFVVCDTAGQVIAVVDLQTDQFSERAQKRLHRMTRTLEAAQIPMHLWRADRLPSPEEVRRTVLPRSSVAPEIALQHPGATAAFTLPSGLLGVTEPVLGPNPFDELDRDSSQDETIEMLEQRPSTWFDEFDSKPMPLNRR